MRADGVAEGDEAIAETLLPANHEPEVTADPDDTGTWRMPQALQSDIAAWRTQVLQVAIAEHPAIAYDLLVFRLVTCIADRRDQLYRPSALDLMASPTRPDSSLQDATPAKQALESHEQALPWTWLEDRRHDDGDRFDRFCRLTREEKDRLMAWAVASTIKPQIDGSAPRTREYELAGAAAAVDIRRYWTPAATNYWGRTTKAHMVAVLDELTNGHGDHYYVTMRKDALVATLERLFNSGDAAVSDAAKAAATRWLPPGMAFHTAVKASSIDRQPAPYGDASAAGTA